MPEALTSNNTGKLMVSVRNEQCWRHLNPITPAKPGCQGIKATIPEGLNFIIGIFDVVLI